MPLKHESARYLTNNDKRLPGTRRALTIPAPAAGAEVIIKVPSGVQWKILSARFSLATSGAAGQRIVRIDETFDGVVTYSITSSVNPIAAQSLFLSLSDSVGYVAPVVGTGFGVIPIPQTWLPQGATVGTNTTAIDVADQYSAVNVLVSECYLTNQELSVNETEREQAADVLAHALALATQLPAT